MEGSHQHVGKQVPAKGSGPKPTTETVGFHVLTRPKTLIGIQHVYQGLANVCRLAFETESASSVSNRQSSY